jgi:XrtN system VIT domain protein
MRKVNTSYLADDFITADVIAEAEKAYVVSPVSSLIVLETQKDYDRFDIKESKDSLKNASHNSSGAVPEPHEWMLIILTMLVVSYFMCKHYLWK